MSIVQRAVLTTLALLVAVGCNDEPLVQVPDPIPLPEPVVRPADPGLSYAFSCLIEGPIVNPLEYGSRPLSGIPAITDPDFVAAADASYLFPEDWVFGVEIAGRFLAFPARILNYHEVTTFSVDSYRYAASW